MSWVFGIIGSLVDNNIISRCQAIHAKAIGTFQEINKYYIAAGGFPLTCLLSHADNNNNLSSFDITLGNPLLNTSHNIKRLTHSDWIEIDADERKIEKLDGHYIRIRYANDRFTINNDKLGLRTLYWLETGSGTILSSRLDWISRYVGGLNINFSKLGSRWLIFNQLTYDAPVDNVMRLGPSGHLTISNSGLHYYCSAFVPTDPLRIAPNEFVEKLHHLINPEIENDLCISLGLSGGLDSRVLLAFLLSTKKIKYSTHTFGSLADPDVAIPADISRKEEFPHHTYDTSIPEAASVIALLRDYVIQTNLIEPISTVLRLRHYNELDNSKYLLMDGGFGEIARRQYLNRFVLNGRKAIENKTIAVVFNNLRTHRGNIFNDDVNDKMRSGVNEEISQMLETMPDINKVGIENYLDLWAVRTRIPNFGSDEQGRLDSTILNYMPFAQPSFINDVLNMPIKYRRNGYLFREIIKSRIPSLAKHPLVKGNTTYPFILPTYASWLLVKAKNKLGYQYQDNSINTFLNMIKPFVLDLLHSRATIEYAPYNYPLISKNVLGYYAGNQSLSNEVNWWLSFELWRQNI